MTLRGALLVAAAASLAAAGPVGEFVNSRVQRKIDVSKHVVTSTTSFRVLSTGGAALSKYYLALTAEEAAHLAFIGAEEEGTAARLPVSRDDTVDAKAGFVHFLVRLRKPATAAESANVRQAEMGGVGGGGGRWGGGGDAIGVGGGVVASRMR
jgi:hypothetical protein